MGVEEKVTIDEEVVPGADDKKVDEPQLASIKDDELVEVVVRGETVRKPWKEARAGIQMQDDYTRSKQDLAKQAKELQTLYEAVKGRQSELDTREAAIKAALGGHKAEEPPDPDEVLTRRQLQEILNSHSKDVDERLSKTWNERSEADTQARMFERWEGLTTQTASHLIKEHPVLAVIPELATVLKRAAAKDGPQTEDDMVKFMTAAGNKIAADLEKHTTESHKEEALKKKRLVENGPLPPGGRASFEPPAKSYVKGRKVDYNAIEKDVISAIEQLNED